MHIACTIFKEIERFLCAADVDSEQNMSMILGVGPALGFFLVPVIGRASDRCRSKFGRRRPFIFLLSILLVVSLIVIPYAEAICSWLFGRSTELTSTLSVTTMIIGAILLDFSCQTCLTPCEALLSDLRYHYHSLSSSSLLLNNKYIAVLVRARMATRGYASHSLFFSLSYACMSSQTTQLSSARWAVFDDVHHHLLRRTAQQEGSVDCCLRVMLAAHRP